MSCLPTLYPSVHPVVCIRALVIILTGGGNFDYNCVILNHAVTVESTGALPPEVLFTEAIKILVEKCQRVFTELS